MTTSAKPANEPQNATSNASERIYQQIAEAHGIELFYHYSEAEAAKLVRLSVSTLKRARQRDSIGHIQKGENGIAYFGYQLVDFLTSTITCPKPQSISIN
ncbi:MAG: hypothetical protein AAF292_11135 [Pseudomonadota bacterium]